jgi:magnesium chelatase subunit D
VVAARPADTVTDLAIGATITAAAARRALTLAPDRAPTGVAPASPAPLGVEAGDLRQAVREARTAHLVVLAVDTSGSMGAQRRIEAAKGAVLSLLLDAYQRRDRVALVTFAGDTATVVLRPTGSVEVARTRLAALPTGGRTPLAAGLRTALEVARQAHRQDPGRRAVLVVVTDGRATSGSETSRQGTSGVGSTPTDEALAAAAEVRAAGLDVLVVDAEDSAVRLGLARTLADHMGARHTVLPDLAGAPLAGVVNDFLLRPPQPGFG